MELGVLTLISVGCGTEFALVAIDSLPAREEVLNVEVQR